jgi:hypothetical protein
MGAELHFVHVASISPAGEFVAIAADKNALDLPSSGDLCNSEVAALGAGAFGTDLPLDPPALSRDAKLTPATFCGVLACQPILF